MVLSFLKDLALNSKWNFAYACHESAKQPVKSSPAKLNKRKNFNLLFTWRRFCSMLVRLLDILTRYKEKQSGIRAQCAINAKKRYPNRRNIYGFATIRRRNSKTEFSLWKHIKCFLFTPRTRSLMTQQSLSASLDLCLTKTRAEKSHHFRDVIAFKKLRFWWVWTVGLTVEIKLRF